MDMSPDFLIVGAPYDNTNVGCVYVFPNTGPNNFDYFHYDILRFPGTGSFGNDVALHGHTLVVGAPGLVFDLPYVRMMYPNGNSGEVFVYISYYETRKEDSSFASNLRNLLPLLHTNLQYSI